MSVNNATLKFFGRLETSTSTCEPGVTANLYQRDWPGWSSVTARSPRCRRCPQMSRAFGQESLLGASATQAANADVVWVASTAVAVTNPLEGRFGTSMANWAAPLASSATCAVPMRPLVVTVGLQELTA